MPDSEDSKAPASIGFAGGPRIVGLFVYGASGYNGFVNQRRRVLVADDEPNLLASVVYALKSEGYEVDAAGDGESAWLLFKARRPDLVLLDIIMPRADGTELLRRIRAEDRDLPVMFLSSKDEEFDRVLGLELGADDYLCKPFSMRELLARVRALMRRARACASEPAASQRVEARGIVLDPDRFEASLEGLALRLTITEFRLLSALLAAPGLVKTREALLSAAYPEETYLNDRAIDCHIKRLRRKIEGLGGSASLIETVYGLGYRLRKED